MAFEIPSLADVLQRTRQAFKSNMPDSDPWLWPSNIYVSAKVIAGRIWEAFHRLDWVLKQAFPLTADDEQLDRHGQAYAITRKAAVAASGLVTGTGATALTFVPTGTLLQRSDGAEYVTTADFTVAADGLIELSVDASESGIDGNLTSGAELTFATAIAGLPTSVVVSDIDAVDGGRDLEDDEELRVRILQRLQYPPHAGSRQDYIRWVLEVPGVTRAFVEPRAYGPGTLGVWFMMDQSYADGIPQAADVATVQAYLDSLAPITANPIVAAPVAEPIRIEVTGLSPFNADIIAAVKAEIEAMIGTLSSVSTASDIKYIRRSWIWQAVANATGEQYHSIQLPAADVAISVGKVIVYDENYITITGAA